MADTRRPCWFFKPDAILRHFASWGDRFPTARLHATAGRSVNLSLVTISRPLKWEEWIVYDELHAYRRKMVKRGKPHGDFMS